jgi:hypothetical protein
MVDLHISFAGGDIVKSIEDLAKTALAVAPIIYKGFRFLQKRRRTKERKAVVKPLPTPPEEKPLPVVD